MDKKLCSWPFRWISTHFRFAVGEIPRYKEPAIHYMIAFMNLGISFVSALVGVFILYVTDPDMRLWFEISAGALVLWIVLFPVFTALHTPARLQNIQFVLSDCLVGIGVSVIVATASGLLWTGVHYLLMTV